MLHPATDMIQMHKIYFIYYFLYMKILSYSFILVFNWDFIVLAAFYLM